MRGCRTITTLDTVLHYLPVAQSQLGDTALSPEQELIAMELLSSL